MVKLQEAENQIVIDYEVYDQRSSDLDLLIPAIETHEAKLGSARRVWWRQTLGSTPPRMRLRAKAQRRQTRRISELPHEGA